MKNDSLIKLPKINKNAVFSYLFRNCRMDLNFTQEKMAEVLNLTRDQVASYEHQRCLPNLNDVINFVSILGQPFDVWVRAHFQQQLLKSSLNFKVDIKNTSKKVSV